MTQQHPIQPIEEQVDSIVFFENGNIAVFDKDGQQIPDLQDGWLNWEQIKKMANIIATQDVSVTGSCPHLETYINVFKQLSQEESIQPKSGGLK